MQEQELPANPEGTSHMLEPLESRQLLSAMLGADGVLIIDGTDADDSIVVWQPDRHTMRVQLNGSITDLDRSQVQSIRIDAAGGDDSVAVTRRAPAALILGGPGDDSLHSGGGHDTLVGGDGDDSLFGGLGDDALDGQDGADDMSGGRGIDLADYSSRSDGITVHIGFIANDGRPGERDNVHWDIEQVRGGSGSDRLKNWGHHSVTLWGGSGEDTLVGQDADDELIGGSGSDKLHGRGGNDRYFASGDDAADQIVGGTILDQFDADEIDLVLMG
jgi:Ca2+-binding RTX toxin-like protein